MSEESVHFLLIRWAEWQRRYEGIYRIPATILRHGRGRTSGAEESRRRNSRRKAKWQRCAIVDRCIDDLPVPAQRAAIHRRYLSSVVSDARLSCVTRRGHGAALVAFRRKGILA